MAKAKQIIYTENDRAIVDALKNAPEGLTLAELKETTDLDLKSGHLVSAKNKGLIATAGQIEIISPSKRSVSTYTYVSSDVAQDAKGKPYNYSDNETAILAAAAKMEGFFTLAELAVAMGVEKVQPGSVNSLVNPKGNLEKGDQVEIPAVKKSKVNVYVFVKDIPTDAE